LLLLLLALLAVAFQDVPQPSDDFAIAGADTDAPSHDDYMGDVNADADADADADVEEEVEVEERPPQQPQQHSSSLFVEPSGPLKEWQAAHERELDQKRASSTQRREQQRKQAQQDVDKFFEERQAKIKKAHAGNVQQEQALTNERDQKQGSANGWPRVMYLIESSGASSSSASSNAGTNSATSTNDTSSSAAAAVTTASNPSVKKHPARDTSRLREILTKLRHSS
jgi:hypothetical protein